MTRLASTLTPVLALEQRHLTLSAVVESTSLEILCSNPQCRLVLWAKKKAKKRGSGMGELRWYKYATAYLYGGTYYCVDCLKGLCKVRENKWDYEVTFM